MSDMRISADGLHNNGMPIQGAPSSIVSGLSEMCRGSRNACIQPLARTVSKRRQVGGGPNAGPDDPPAAVDGNPSCRAGGSGIWPGRGGSAFRDGARQRPGAAGRRTRPSSNALPDLAGGHLGWAQVVVAAAALLLLAGCAPRAEGPARERLTDRRPAAPFGTERGSFLWADWRSDPAGRSGCRVLCPIFEYESPGGRRVTVVRPLLSHEDEGPGSDRWAFRALWPLFLLESKDESGRLRLFPFVWWRERVNRDGVPPERDMDWAVMPFLWGGSDSSEGKYFALWPVAGRIDGIFGKKYIRFAAWPLWVEAEDPRYHSWNAPWPFFGIWRGPDQRGWRLWPLCGQDEREGHFKRQFLLWPVFHHWKTHPRPEPEGRDGGEADDDDEDEDEPADASLVWKALLNADTDWRGEVWAVFPLWMSARSSRSGYVCVLWPFFGRRASYAHDFTEWHCPWPFVSWTNGAGVHGWKLWPLYGWRQAPRSSSRTVLWPLYVRQTADEGPERSTTVTSAFVFRRSKVEWVEEPAGDRRVRRPPPPTEEMERMAAERAGREPDAIGRKDRPLDPDSYRCQTSNLLWPVFRWRNSETGETYFTVLEPWWWRDTEVWDRHYGPFFTLYRYERFEDGAARHRALFNLFECGSSPVESYWRLTPLFSWEREELSSGRSLDWRFLGGLVGYERRGDEWRLRLFWIPLGRKPGEGRPREDLPEYGP